MTDKQPEALRLADWLEADACDLQPPMDAAAELRRLSRVETELLAMRSVFSEAGCTFDVIYIRRLVRAEAQRDELLAAAKKLLKELEALRDSDEYWGPVNDADDALIDVIVKVEGRT